MRVEKCQEPENEVQGRQRSRDDRSVCVGREVSSFELTASASTEAQKAREPQFELARPMDHALQ